jgi:uncharacterized protein (TIGR02996 family)
MDYHAAFLADIIAHPADDAPRLIYADWLEDNGEEERAEFIRVQCELAARAAGVSRGHIPAGSLWHPAIDDGAILRRERNLLFDHWPRWLHQSCDPLAYDVGVFARDDNDFGVSLYDWQKREQGHFDCSFRRGFIAEVKLPLAAWLEHGKELVAAHPLEKVTLADREPAQSSREWFWTTGTNEPWQLPEPIWERLHRPLHGHPSRETALDALSLACLAWARQPQEVTT